jgi:predicted O-linked N-acetylglucosamine transferase (SPINDLY family)
MLAFARKPAPVQVAWLAYPATTGLEAMDYRLTDPYLDPPGTKDQFYSEKSIRLPNTFWCYDPLTSAPVANPLPADRNGHITFGCLNDYRKVNDGVLKLWARVLNAVPDSKLLLLCPQGSPRQRAMNSLGVAPGRVEFLDRIPRARYLQYYHRIDVGLDTYPYNGHTTSLDGLWMGVPTVTMCGETAVSRAGFSQLSNLGLSELAASDEEQFVDIAARLGKDVARLRELRSSLRERMMRSPLMDAQRFARDMEQAYRSMWRQWCALEPRP